MRGFPHAFSACLVPALLMAALPSLAASPVLVNPSFETPYLPVTSYTSNVSGNLAHGWADLSYGTVSAAYAEQTANPHGGTACQQVTLSEVGANSGFQMGQQITLPGGTLNTPGLWFRGTPGTRLDLVLIQPVSPWFTYGDAPVYLTGTWQFVAFPAHMVENTPAIFMVQGSQPTTFCMDDAALDSVPGAIAPSPPTHTALSDFGMHINNYTASKGPRNLGFESPFYPVNSAWTSITGELGAYWIENSAWAGNSVTVAYSANTSTPHSGRAAQRMVVTQVAGDAQIAQFAYLRYQQTYTSSIWVRATPGMSFSYGLRAWYAPYAYLAQKTATGTGKWEKLTVTGAPSAAGPSVLMVAAYSTGTLDIDDITLTDSTGKTPELALPWPSTPIGTWRLWDQFGTTWAYLEPAKGTWNFDLLDEAVADAEAHGTAPMLTLGQTPQWASTRPHENDIYGAGAAAMPAHLEDWTDYIETVATRYKGRIKIYEIWNEPNDPGTFKGSIAQMVTLTQAAQTTLKQIDPAIQVVSPPPYIVGWLGQFLAAGGGNYADAIGYHQYSFEVAPEDDARVLADLKTAMANAGQAGKPLWITEGAAGDTTTDGITGMGLLGRKYLIDLMYGAGRFNWYTWGPATEFCLGTTGVDGISATFAGLGLARLESWLDGSAVEGVTVAANGIYAVQLNLGNGTAAIPAYIVWSRSGNKTWTVPMGFTARQGIPLIGDPLGFSGATSIPASPEPMLIEGTN